MNLAAFGIHHDGDGVSLVLVEPPDALNDLAVPLARAVAHVDARYVHAANGERFELVESGGGGSDGAYELGAPGGTESVLPELSFGDGVDLDGAGKSMVGVRRRGLEPRGGLAVVGDENGRLAIGGGGSDGELWERRRGGLGGGGDDRQPAIEGGEEGGVVL